MKPASLVFKLNMFLCINNTFLIIISLLYRMGCALSKHGLVFNIAETYKCCGARGWSRHYATSRKAVGSVPHVDTGIFYWHNPSASIWPWGQHSHKQIRVPAVFPGGKGGWCVGLTTLPPSCDDCPEIWETYRPGHLRACQGIALLLPLPSP